ncbi:Short-chain dehydrogenase/reductase family protein [Mycena venus]|uniref:Short-chain dehydrogenase/reductase family protein n=1 Tax=Mycena venus TaxID=2733690 RepID=A0A8H6YRE4_9AGAR|nr:Short-chain dehydrogenase/reductase family protein [Mycena venus]
MVRTILVTGSNQGLGMHTVHQLGSTPDIVVFMGSRKLAAAEEALSKFAADVHSSSTVVPVQLDITDASSIKAAHAFVSDFLKERGITSLDVLVNNAGIFVPSIEETYAVNVFGTVAVTEAFRTLLSKGGTIINISSGFGSIASYPKRPKPVVLLPGYSSSKAALNMLTVQWAMQEEEKGSGISVVSICPGFNATNLSNYAEAAKSPADGCKIIVKTALEKEGRTGVFFNEDRDLEW